MSGMKAKYKSYMKEVLVILQLNVVSLRQVSMGLRSGQVLIPHHNNLDFKLKELNPTNNT